MGLVAVPRGSLKNRASEKLVVNYKKQTESTSVSELSNIRRCLNRSNYKNLSCKAWIVFYLQKTNLSFKYLLQSVTKTFNLGHALLVLEQHPAQPNKTVKQHTKKSKTEVRSSGRASWRFWKQKGILLKEHGISGEVHGGRKARIVKREAREASENVALPRLGEWRDAATFFFPFLHGTQRLWSQWNRNDNRFPDQGLMVVKPST